MYVYTYVYVCMYMYTYIYIYVYGYMYRHILCNIHNIRLRPPRGLNLEPYFPILSEILSHYHSIPLFTNMGCRFYQSIKKVLDFRSQVNVANGATLEEHPNSRITYKAKPFRANI